jgi:hypothetical protein
MAHTLVDRALQGGALILSVSIALAVAYVAQIVIPAPVASRERRQDLGGALETFAPRDDAAAEISCR